MTLVRSNDSRAVKRAKEIAHKTLLGNYDLLLACRDIADIRRDLPLVADDLIDTFVGVASEVDDLPLGPERTYWAAEALGPKDARAENYRGRIRLVVVDALQKLLVTLGKDDQTD
jgi:hypothetical protein